MSAWTDETIRRRQRWFPWTMVAMGAIMAFGYAGIELQPIPSLAVFAITFGALLLLALAAARARVTPRGSTIALSGALLASFVLRPFTGLAATALGGGVLVTTLAAVVAVVPFFVVAVVYARRLR